ncbi:hypothetical protein LRS10_13750 [Phenylobacterium sp. J426]|uniref:hypothetical protein n=1 Tax=Phenylobacterium sp. J426 TaxID=2898439 RepID=UPI00215081F5|nr:hypothetical protein [Phenylobacterium sp. J426]MCR5875158.1 hypothetical protein [Phenylobacterium sp. J426]
MADVTSQYGPRLWLVTPLNDQMQLSGSPSEVLKAALPAVVRRAKRPKAGVGAVHVAAVLDREFVVDDVDGGKPILFQAHRAEGMTLTVLRRTSVPPRVIAAGSR